MEIPTFRLRSREYEKIERILKGIMEECSASSVFLITRSGQELAFEGELEESDRDAVSSLAAGHLAATVGLAGLIGEKEFSRVYHRGKVWSLLMSPAGEHALLLLILRNGAGDREGLRTLGRSLMVLDDLLSASTEGAARETGLENNIATESRG